MYLAENAGSDSEIVVTIKSGGDELSMADTLVRPTIILLNCLFCIIFFIPNSFNNYICMFVFKPLEEPGNESTPIQNTRTKEQARR